MRVYRNTHRKSFTPGMGRSIFSNLTLLLPFNMRAIGGRMNIIRLQAKEETPSVCAKASTTKPVAKPMVYCNDSGSSSGSKKRASRKRAGVI